MTDSTRAAFWCGSYTQDMGGEAEGIGALLRREDGTLEYAGVAARTDSPSFLAQNPRDERIVYAVSEASGRLEAYLRGEGTSLTLLGVQQTDGSGRDEHLKKHIVRRVVRDDYAGLLLPHPVRRSIPEEGLLEDQRLGVEPQAAAPGEAGA